MANRPEADSPAWWEKGVRFECQGSGQCCVSHGNYGHVYLTKEDRIRMAQHLGMSTMRFTREYCYREDGVFALKPGESDACRFLEGKRCGVYQGRPTQCRTWPFWPEVMSAKVWSKEVASFCPGVGKGKVWTAEEIKKALQEQSLSEERYGS